MTRPAARPSTLRPIEARDSGDPLLLARAALGLAATWAPTGTADPGRTGLLAEALTALPAGQDQLTARLLSGAGPRQVLGARSRPASAAERTGGGNRPPPCGSSHPGDLPGRAQLGDLGAR